MENYAKRLALEHSIQGKASKKYYPIYSMKSDFDIIRKSYDLLTQSVSLDIPIPPSGEWILDNFYVIEEQVNSIEEELNFKEYEKLPSVKGKARIYLIAEELVKYTDGNVTKEMIERFISAYESKRKISMNEIWIFPVMLKIALIKYIRIVSERMITSQYQKFKVASLAERIIENKPVNEQAFSQYRSINLNGEISAYVEFLVYLLKKEGKSAKKYLDVLDQEIQKAGTTLDEIIKTEHYDMALRRVSVSNSITSIKNILRYNWSEIFEKINGIENILLEDSWYDKFDYDTKTLYRNEIQKIAKEAKLSETYVASSAIELSKKMDKHVGEFLVGEEREMFLESLGISGGHGLKTNKKLFLYLFFIYLPALIISILTMKHLFFISIIPLSEAFMLIVNKVISKIKKPKTLPRLEEIPSNIKTFVIIPTLVKSKEKVKEIIENLEVFYLSNKIDNLFFALLGDASEEDEEHMPFDDEITDVGINMTAELNKKYGDEKFFFLYRQRKYNKSQGKWLGYERKRGMITEFVDFLVTGNNGTFIVNTIKDIPKIKYIITLDSDTILPIDSAKKLIGTMEHPLNKPYVEGNIVTKGYGLIQPKVGITMEASTASTFAKLFAGDGGIDGYSTAESNVYQDLFGEGIFTGKGIFSVDLFYKLLKDEIPENTVLSHDLLEGSYLRCGLASDIEVVDGFPSKVNSYMLRLHRWTRGDWQIAKWIFKKPLNKLSKYKIFDNLRRSVLDIFLLLLLFSKYFYISLVVIFTPFILDVFEKIINYKSGLKAKNYLPVINGVAGSFLRCAFELSVLPYKAVLMIKAIGVTLYRTLISKKHLLEWVTAADAEKSLGNKFSNYIREMISTPIFGILYILLALWRTLFATTMDGTTIVAEHSVLHIARIIFIFKFLISSLWLGSPLVCYLISKPNNKQTEKITEEGKQDLIEIAKRTWNYFDENMNAENNFLPPDNYQVGRKNKLVNTTSSTNIGLGLMSIISAYDIGFITRETCIEKLKQSIDVIINLEKWNGHLYNWYNIKKLVPLNPRFISTVDSGNFVGYLYVVNEFLKLNDEKDYSEKIEQLIQETDFSKLYDPDKNLFSIGYDIRENKLVDSYYDLLASEARLASFIAIAKRDVPYKHWFSMSRTLTCIDRYKGLVSWSGTMFEYFMPMIVMKPYRYTLLDETYEFCIYSQKKYARKLNIPWGISESAFNLQDLNYNYQYKAFGIPWLGLKRGLKEEVVVSPYSSFLTLSKNSKDVLKNSNRLKELGAYDKYGFYDAIDFTPNRVSKEGYSIVKTFMAHHEALILLSINNYLNDNILQKRFSENKEVESAEILLQERVPTNVVFTKKKKEKIKVLKYKNYEEHVEESINIPCGNVNIQSNNSYTLLTNDFGEGYSTYEGLLLTKHNDITKQGSCVFIKDLENGEVVTNTALPLERKNDEFEIKFSPSLSKFYRKTDKFEIKTKIAISSEENIELREIEIKNTSEKELNLDVMTYLEPVLAYPNDDIVHPAYNSLFFRSVKHENAIILEKRLHNDIIYYLNFVASEEEGQEFELDKSKIVGRLNTIQNPIIANTDVAYSSENNTFINTVISFKKNLKIPVGEKKSLYIYYGVSKNKNEILEMYDKYKTLDGANRLFELAYSKNLIENRFLGYKGKDILMYNKLFSLLSNNNTREKYLSKINQNVLKQKNLWRFGISGDLPIILVKINRVNDAYVVKDLMQAIEYFNKKNVWVDLIVLNEEESKYEQYVQDRLYQIISTQGLQYLLHRNGGIFIIKKNDISFEEECLLLSCSDMILNARDGFLKEQLEG